MTKQNAKTPDKSSTLDDILSELESRFGSSADKSSTKKPVKKKSFLSSAQSFYAVLGLVLLVVGAGIATFLTQRQQDLRQQATIYNGICDFATDGSECSGTGPGQACGPNGQGVCVEDSIDPSTGQLGCSCNLNTVCEGNCLSSPTSGCGTKQTDIPDATCGSGFRCCPANVCEGSCLASLVTGCGSDETEEIDFSCSLNKRCCPIGVPITTIVPPILTLIPTSIPTATPGQGGNPTNTPVPPTNTPRPTNTPTPRPTNTPTRTPTPTNTPTPLADLELIKRVSNSSPIVGGIITYTIELTNKGPNNATNIVVSDATLFEALGLEFIPGSLSLSHGTVNYTTGEWSIPLLRVNEVATLSADVRVLTVGTKFNQAQVKDVDQEDPDSTPGNIEEPGHQDEDDEDSAVVNPVEPSATATPAPLCLNITMTNPFRGNGEPTQIGDTVTFTCGEVSFAQRYEFRVQLPNGTIVTLNPTASGARISEPFSLSQTGQYKAQCRICNDVAGNFCGEWENL